MYVQSKKQTDSNKRWKLNFLKSINIPQFNRHLLDQFQVRTSGVKTRKKQKGKKEKTKTKLKSNSFRWKYKKKHLIKQMFKKNMKFKDCREICKKKKGCIYFNYYNRNTKRKNKNKSRCILLSGNNGMKKSKTWKYGNLCPQKVVDEISLPKKKAKNIMNKRKKYWLGKVLTLLASEFE